MKQLHPMIYGQYLVGSAKARPNYNHEIATKVAAWIDGHDYGQAFSYLEMLPLFEQWHGIDAGESFKIGTLEISTDQQRLSTALKNELQWWARAVYGLWRRNESRDWTLPFEDRKK